jgi:hypothetical protein
MRGVVSGLDRKHARSPWSPYANCNTYDTGDRDLQGEH